MDGTVQGTGYSVGVADNEMREPTFWILTALASGRRHGYALIADTAELSDGRVKLRATTLYAALDRLEQQGLVRPDGEEAVDGRLRRYFTITDNGSARLTDEITRLETNARQARARLASILPVRSTVRTARAGSRS
jgi:DNA-binding PadR family transcriptional regulator